MVAQLRAGKCPLLKSYLHSIGKAESPYCEWCPDEIDDVGHALIDCTQGEEARNAIFVFPTEEKLLRAPEQISEYFRRVGRVQMRPP